MNNKYISSLINSILSTLFLTSLIEGFTYSGFIAKHFNLLVGIVILLIFLVLFIIFYKIYKSRFLNNVSFGLSFLMVFIYFLMDILDKTQYRNFVFSHFHLQVYLLLLPVILIVCVFLVNSKGKGTRVFLYTTLILILISFLITDFNKIIKRLRVVKLEDFGLSYDQKMEKIIGKVAYDYIMFVKNNTPENSIILIPPQGYPWPQTGNKAYIRYFLYPRQVINGNEKDSIINVGNVDYVLIDYGEDNTISEFGFTNIWPKFNIDSEYIIYWNPSSGTTRKAFNQKYIYKSDNNIEKWGIIKVKK